jgi:hypothetical protein
MENWEVVYRSGIIYRAEIVKGVLEQHDIQSIIVSKKDSNYHFGHYEVLVSRESIIRAIKIIKDDIQFE